MAQTSCHSVFTGSPPLLLSDLDLNDNDLKWSGFDLQLVAKAGRVLELQRIATGLLDSEFRVGSFRADGWRCTDTAGWIRPYRQNGAKLELESYYGADLVVATCLNGAFDINRGGNIALLSGKYLRLASDGELRIPTTLGGGSPTLSYDTVNEQLVIVYLGTTYRFDHV